MSYNSYKEIIDEMEKNNKIMDFVSKDIYRRYYFRKTGKN